MDGCPLVDGCQTAVYDTLRPGRGLSGGCDECCCQNLTTKTGWCTPAKDCAWWTGQDPDLDDFYGLHIETLNYSSTVGAASQGTLTLVGRFKAATPRALSKGVRMFRRRLDDSCDQQNCGNGRSLQVAVDCDDCEPAGEANWVTLTGLELAEWVEFDELSDRCVQSISIVWNTDCPTGTRTLSTVTVGSAAGVDLPCDLTICQPDPEDPCVTCAGPVVAPPPSLYRGCWCDPIYQTAFGVRLAANAECYGGWTARWRLASFGSIAANVRVVGWVSHPNTAPPWQPEGRSYYRHLTPVTDTRIPAVRPGDLASLTPETGAALRCNGETKQGLLEGPHGGLITVPAMSPGQELVMTVYADTWAMPDGGLLAEFDVVENVVL